MKAFCRKFEKTILFLLKLSLYASLFFTFFRIFSIVHYQVFNMSRTAAVTMSTFVMMEFLLTGIYGKYNIGERKSKPIIFSLVLAVLITDVAAYFMLTIMNTNEANDKKFRIEYVSILMLIMSIQIWIIIIMVYFGNFVYFWLRDPEKCCIVTEEGKDTKKLQEVIGTFKKKYKVTQVVDYRSPHLEQAIIEVNTVFLYDLPMKERTQIVDFCYQNLKNIYFNPRVADILEQNSRQVILDDMSFLASEFHSITWEQRIVKRLMDITISILALILTSPILFMSALCIKKYDGGKVLFKQKRVTVHGRIFWIYKFRTMRENVENYSTIKDDERITPVGRFIRKYRIDELPQLLNIIKGDMSLVGPRPEMVENVDDYTKKMPEFRYRLRMKAGLTGYAQINGKYNTSSRDKLMMDLMYIENYSILKDIQLLFQTVMVLFKAEDSTAAFEENREDNEV